MRAQCMRNNNQILHGDQIRCEENFAGSTTNAICFVILAIGPHVISNSSFDDVHSFRRYSESFIALGLYIYIYIPFAVFPKLRKMVFM